jgi:hypothetical protein
VLIRERSESRYDSTNFCNADVINGNGGNNNNASNVFGISPDFYKTAITIKPNAAYAVLERRLFPDVFS